MFVVLSEGPGRGFRLAEPASLPRTKPNGNLEEISHQSNLSLNIAFPDSFRPSLPDHIHDFIAADCNWPSRLLPLSFDTSAHRICCRSERGT